MSVTVTSTSAAEQIVKLRAVKVSSTREPGRLFALRPGFADESALVEFDPRTGAVLRETRLPNGGGDPSMQFLDQAIAYDGAFVYVLAADGSVSRLDLDANVQERYALSGNGALDGLAVGGGELFTVGTPESITAYDLDTGRERSIPAPGASFGSALTYGGQRGTLFLTSSNTFAEFAVSELNVATGEVVNSFSLAGQASIAYSDGLGALYVYTGQTNATEQRQIELVDPDTGTSIGRFVLDNRAGLAEIAADATSRPTYLEIAPTTVTLAPGASSTLSLALDAARLYDGTFSARVEAIADGDVVGTLPVTFDVAGMPVLALRQDPVQLGEVPLGETSRDTVYVSNAGTAELRVALELASGAGFSASPTRLVLAPGDSAAVALEFEASVAGDATSTLQLTTNAPASPSVSIVLRARAVRPPAIDVTPNALSATVESGRVSSDALLVQNLGDQVLSFSVWLESARGAQPALFAASAGLLQLDPVTFAEIDRIEDLPEPCCFGRSIALDGSLLYLLTRSTDTIEIFDLGSKELVRTIEPVAGVSRLLTLAHDGTHLYSAGGETGRDILRYSEDGLAVDARFVLPAEYQAGADMAAAEGELFVLARSNEGDAVVVLDSETGILQRVIPLSDDDLLSYTTPTGIELVEGKLVVSGSIAAGAYDPVTGALVGLIEHGNSSLYTLAYAESYALWAAAAPALGDVNAEATSAITVTFDATRLFAGTYTGDLRIESNDPASPVTRVPVELVVTGEPDISLTSNALAFRSVTVGAQREQFVTVDNTGTANLEIAVSAPDGIEVLPARSSVAPGEAVELAIRYAPTTPALLDASLSIGTNDPDEPTLTIALSGEAMAAPEASLESADRIEVSLASGETDVGQVTVNNAGPGALRFSVAARPADRTGGSVLYVADREASAVHQVEAATGLRTTSFELPVGRRLVALAASADVLYAVTAGSRTGLLLSVYDLDTGETVLSTPTRDIRRLAYADGALYALIDFGLWRLDASTGQLEQRISIDGDPSLSPQFGLAAGRGSLFFGAYNFSTGGTELVEISAQSGVLLGRNPSRGTFSPRAFADGRLIGLEGGDNTLLAIDPDSGADRLITPGISTEHVTAFGPTVSWLYAESGENIVAPGAARPIPLALRDEALPAGEYVATLVVLTDDPSAPELTRELVVTIQAGTDADGEAVWIRTAGAPYPNPSTDESLIPFSLPTADPVRIEVFDAMGRQIHALESREYPAGAHHARLSTETLPAGVYTVRLVLGSESFARRLVVVR